MPSGRKGETPSPRQMPSGRKGETSSPRQPRIIDMRHKLVGGTAILLTSMLVPLLGSGGCGPPAEMTQVGTPAEFWQEVRDEPRPVVAVFCKNGQQLGAFRGN